MNTSDRELVERLRQMEIDATEIGGEPHVSKICLEAHSAIERLSKDNERLVEALDKIEALSDLEMADGDGARKIARTALQLHKGE